MSASKRLGPQEMAEFRLFAERGERNVHLAARFGIHVQTVAKYRVFLGLPPAPLGRTRLRPPKFHVPRRRLRDDGPTLYRCETCQQVTTAGPVCARCKTEEAA